MSAAKMRPIRETISLVDALRIVEGATPPLKRTEHVPLHDLTFPESIDELGDLRFQRSKRTPCAFLKTFIDRLAHIIAADHARGYLKFDAHRFIRIDDLVSY